MFVDRIGYSKGTLQDMTHVDNAVQAHVKVRGTQKRERQVFIPLPPLSRLILNFS